MKIRTFLKEAVLAIVCCLITAANIYAAPASPDPSPSPECTVKVAFFSMNGLNKYNAYGDYSGMDVEFLNSSFFQE